MVVPPPPFQWCGYPLPPCGWSGLASSSFWSWRRFPEYRKNTGLEGAEAKAPLPEGEEGRQHNPTEERRKAASQGEGKKQHHLWPVLKFKSVRPHVFDLPRLKYVRPDFLIPRLFPSVVSQLCFAWVGIA